ncbi:FAD-dependent oxidoreductase [Variovorax sp. OV329]|uniref:FAD-dependent oxidoreductase n=1 Tax=Variovorax sp. OV329 TaxID=1882825 RepID=UPI0008E74838|nr:FAD-dependent oxidoreductase [Variovorax sp. OV329]SFM78104.1 FAD dependent oxidoreductase [Variovorax sp. OV329]
MKTKELKTDILVVGGGLGGVAAALGALAHGRQVVMSEEYDWIGGQLTSQAVPPDEHTWVEQFGVTRRYRALRNGIRQFYRDHYPLTEASRAWGELNPGAGWVSRLCAEPRVGLAVMQAMLLPYMGGGQLTVLQPFRPVSADTEGDRVRAVTLRHRDSGEELTVQAAYVIDATETGDLLPLTGTEYAVGFESQADTGEPSAPAQAQPHNVQALSICFAVDHVDGDQTIDKPRNYEHWRSVQPDFWGAPMLSFKAPHPRTLEIVERSFTPNPDDDPLLVDADQRKGGGDMNLWTFRRIAARRNFVPGAYASDICLVNWPMIDYLGGSILDVSEEEKARHLAAAAELSHSMFYWMQTEAPREDGGQGFRGLRLRGDITGTTHGLAMAPYIREGRRVLGVTRVVEQHMSHAVRGEKGALSYRDSVGVGMYRIDLHPSTGGDNYIDVPSCPFEIPLGALLPRRMTNLLAGGKNMATTHITNGCYRLHPVEWNVGEVAGLLAAHCLNTGRTPHQVQAGNAQLAEFQALLAREGVEMRWPSVQAY